jgi:hypothetical protein
MLIRDDVYILINVITASLSAVNSIIKTYTISNTHQTCKTIKEIVSRDWVDFQSG